MGTKNAYADYLARKKARENKLRQEFTLQMCADAAAIAANKIFKRKGKVVADFIEEMVRVFYDIAETADEDGKADKTLVYTKEITDRELKRILEDYFQDWDTRYDAILKQNDI